MRAHTHSIPNTYDSFLSVPELTKSEEKNKSASTEGREERKNSREGITSFYLDDNKLEAACTQVRYTMK